MVKHTRGPWLIASDDDCHDMKFIVSPAQTYTIATLTTSAGVSDDLLIANAHLVAAAPELLEACEAAKEFLVPNLVEPGRTVFWKLVAALEKAKGVALVSGTLPDSTEAK